MRARKQADRNNPAGRILLFPTRNSPRKELNRTFLGAKGSGGPDTSVGDLSKYERGDQADDYPRRMIINSIAFVFIIMLTLAGVWLAETMAALRKNQDCALSGRRDCAPVAVETRDR